jgi:hypothetical protein
MKMDYNPEKCVYGPTWCYLGLFKLEGALRETTKKSIINSWVQRRICIIGSSEYEDVRPQINPYIR